MEPATSSELQYLYFKDRNISFFQTANKRLLY